MKRAIAKAIVKYRIVILIVLLLAAVWSVPQISRLAGTMQPGKVGSLQMIRMSRGSPSGASVSSMIPYSVG